MQPYRQIPVFQLTMLSPSSELKHVGSGIEFVI
jgi:hypothetical protein